MPINASLIYSETAEERTVLDSHINIKLIFCEGWLLLH